MSLKPTSGLGSLRTASKSMALAMRYEPLPPRVVSTARTPPVPKGVVEVGQAVLVGTGEVVAHLVEDVLAKLYN